MNNLTELRKSFKAQAAWHKLVTERLSRWRVNYRRFTENFELISAQIVGTDVVCRFVEKSWDENNIQEQKVPLKVFTEKDWKGWIGQEKAKATQADKERMWLSEIKRGRDTIKDATERLNFMKKHQKTLEKKKAKSND